MWPRPALLADARELARSALLVGFVSCVLAAPVQGQALESDSRFTVELEAAVAWQAKNDVQVPNDASGTRIALDGLTGSGPFPAVRLYAEYRPGRRHGLRLLAAPLSLVLIVIFIFLRSMRATISQR